MHMDISHLLKFSFYNSLQGQHIKMTTLLKLCNVFSNIFLFECIFANVILPHIYICDIPLILHMSNM